MYDTFDHDLDLFKVKYHAYKTSLEIENSSQSVVI